jgi:hypothetical protein
MINRTDSKDIQITNLMDFTNLIDEIKQLNLSATGFKLFMNEKKVSTHSHMVHQQIQN